MANYGEFLKYYRENKGLTTLGLQRETGISHQNIDRWEKNKVFPSIDFCVQLADFYGISLDELVGRDNYIPPTQSNIDKAENELFNKLPNLSYNQLLIVRDFIDKLIKQSDNK